LKNLNALNKKYTIAPITIRPIMYGIRACKSPNPAPITYKSQFFMKVMTSVSEIPKAVLKPAEEVAINASIY